MKFELSIRGQFRAFHVLEERQEKHEHIWRVVIGVNGPLHEGRIVSLTYLRGLLLPHLSFFAGKFLNEERTLDEASRKQPTCENFAGFFFRKFEKILADDLQTKQLKLSLIEIAVDELDGTETGAIRLTP